MQVRERSIGRKNCGVPRRCRPLQVLLHLLYSDRVWAKCDLADSTVLKLAGKVSGRCGGRAQSWELRLVPDTNLDLSLIMCLIAAAISEGGTCTRWEQYQSVALNAHCDRRDGPWDRRSPGTAATNGEGCPSLATPPVHL